MSCSIKLWSRGDRHLLGLGPRGPPLHLTMRAAVDVAILLGLDVALVILVRGSVALGFFLAIGVAICRLFGRFPLRLSL